MEALMIGEQLSFPFEGDLGLRPRTRRFIPEDNLFVAVRPVLQAIRQAMEIAFDMKRQCDLLASPLPENALHVSMLRFDLRGVRFDEIVSRVKWVLEHIKFEPFELVFDRVISFKGDDRKPLVLCASKDANEPLLELARQIAKELGVKIEGKFNPHMTLLWGDKPVTEQMLDVPVRWVVNEACLIHSLVGKKKHLILWPEQPVQ
jgi:2'-5' RNA ligase